MFGRSRFTYFVSFLALLGPAVAANLFRLDFRSPEEIQADGGIFSRNPYGDGSVIDHVKATLGDQDPWVSTTSSKRLAAAGATSPGNVYVYFINTYGLDVVDTVKEFRKANEVHPHPGEKEFSVRGYVPWENIVEWETFKRGKKTKTTTREGYERGQSGGAKGRSEKRKIAAKELETEEELIAVQHEIARLQQEPSTKLNRILRLRKQRRQLHSKSEAEVSRLGAELDAEDTAKRERLCIEGVPAAGVSESELIGGALTVGAVVIVTTKLGSENRP